jgi:hypothetical protein
MPFLNGFIRAGIYTFRGIAVPTNIDMEKKLQPLIRSFRTDFIYTDEFNTIGHAALLLAGHLAGHTPPA